MGLVIPMGFSVGGGIGPVRGSVPLRVRGPSGRGVAKLIQQGQKEAEKARTAEAARQQAMVQVEYITRIHSGDRAPDTVIGYLQSTADKSRSAERKAFLVRQAHLIEEGFDYAVRVSDAGSITVKLLDTRRVDADKFRVAAQQSIADWVGSMSGEERAELYNGWDSAQYRRGILKRLSESWSPWQVEILRQVFADYMRAWKSQ